MEAVDAYNVTYDNQPPARKGANCGVQMIGRNFLSPSSPTESSLARIAAESAMNQTAIEMFSTLGVAVLCIVLGIMALAIFFTVLRRINRAGAKPETISVRGVLKKDTWAKVHMSGSETFERVRFIGFTDTESIKTHLPYELNGMVILEDEKGCRFLVRAKGIRMIVIEPEATIANKPKEDR